MKSITVKKTNDKRLINGITFHKILSISQPGFLCPESNFWICRSHVKREFLALKSQKIIETVLLINEKELKMKNKVIFFLFSVTKNIFFLF